MAREYNLLHRDALLSDLSAELLRLTERIRPPAQEPRLSGLKVTFYRGGEQLHEILGAATALNYLVEDIYWDEENGNWAAADRLTVETY